ncbi:MAG: hypothetical protein Q4E05_10970, partial [Pseudoclavibacter sp.]|nr:hypothetical protein [Pseudoclavibacter sp.]
MRTTPIPPRFPASLAQLEDPGLCPLCFAPESGAAACARCGYPFEDGRGPEILRLGRIAAEALRERGLLAAAVREEALARARRAAREEPLQTPPAAETPLEAAAPAAAQQTPEAPAVPQAPRRDPDEDAVPRTVPGRESAQPAGPARFLTGRGRSGVQILLLVLGVTLLGVSATVFLTIAWFVFGIGMRSAITALATLGTIAAASWLLRLRLRSTAEGLAGLGCLLVLLDAWAVRALGLAGAERIEAALYWGAALLAATTVLETWSRLAALRVPAITASVLFVPAVGLLAAGTTGAAVSEASRFLIGCTGAAIGALAHGLLR